MVQEFEQNKRQFDKFALILMTKCLFCGLKEGILLAIFIRCAWFWMEKRFRVS